MSRNLEIAVRTETYKYETETRRGKGTAHAIHRQKSVNISYLEKTYNIHGGVQYSK